MSRRSGGALGAGAITRLRALRRLGWEFRIRKGEGPDRAWIAEGAAGTRWHTAGGADARGALLSLLAVIEEHSMASPGWYVTACASGCPEGVVRHGPCTREAAMVLAAVLVGGQPDLQVAVVRLSPVPKVIEMSQPG